MTDDTELISEADSRFILGVSAEMAESQRFGSIMTHGFRRALRDSGATDVLEKMLVNIDDFPDERFPLCLPVPLGKDAEGADKIFIDIDLIPVLTRQFAKQKEDDERFEKATDRWRKVNDRVRGYIPGDAGSFRWTMLTSKMMEQFDYANGDPNEAEQRAAISLGASYAYLGTPFFIPAKRVVDVVTATPPSPSQRSHIHLPTRYVMIFHDGVPLPLLTGSDDEIDVYEDGGRVMRGDSLLIGASLAANDDLTLDTNLAFLIVAAPDPSGTYFGWRPIPIPLRLPSPASNVIWNYAALLAWEDWGIPAKIPETRGKEKSRGYYRTIARSPEGEQGAYQGVRVLNYRPPSPRDLRDAEDAGAEPRRELKYQHKRRSYWKPRIRFGIRDENDQLVGPVYGAGAVEGVTFERRGKLIPRRVVRKDLPERPKEQKVYRIPGTIQRQETL